MKHNIYFIEDFENYSNSRLKKNSTFLQEQKIDLILVFADWLRNLLMCK